MHFKLANIVSGESDKIKEYPELFVKTSAGLQFEDGKLLLRQGMDYDFATFLGCFSAAKWVEYTSLDKFFLHLELGGSATVRIFGFSYHFAQEKMYKKLLVDEIIDRQADLPIDADFSVYELIGIELIANETCTLDQAYWYTDIAKSRLRDVDLSIAITTCFKEEFVKANIALFEDIMASDEPIASHLQIHVVDNGNSLAAPLSSNENIYLHPNPNVGGSGGFARGMMESLETRFGASATHVLVMDDDVEVLPESFIRTYSLLSCVDEAHKNAVVAGAMMSIPVYNELYEDVGHLKTDGYYGPVKGEILDMSDINEVIANEAFPYNKPMQYSAFWYCCIPAGEIERLGLPMPYFIRVDDAEYGMRDPDRIFMTMNGICIWHISLDRNKFRNYLECFYVLRNSLITSAVSPSFERHCSLFSPDFFMGVIDRYIDREWRKFSYSNIELVLDGLEEFLNGPTALVDKDCSAEFKAKGKMKETNEPLDLADIDTDNIWETEGRSIQQRLIARFTKNGHVMTPKRLLGDMRPAAVPNDFYWSPNTRSHMRNTLYLLDDNYRTGFVHTRDQARFNELAKRYGQLLERYGQQAAYVREQWRAAFPYLTSPEFWKGYLNAQAIVQGMDSVPYEE